MLTLNNFCNEKNGFIYEPEPTGNMIKIIGRVREDFDGAYLASFALDGLLYKPMISHPYDALYRGETQYSINNRIQMCANMVVYKKRVIVPPVIMMVEQLEVLSDENNDKYEFPPVVLVEEEFSECTMDVVDAPYKDGGVERTVDIPVADFPKEYGKYAASPQTYVMVQEILTQYYGEQVTVCFYDNTLPDGNVYPLVGDDTVLFNDVTIDGVHYNLEYDKSTYRGDVRYRHRNTQDKSFFLAALGRRKQDVFCKKKQKEESQGNKGQFKFVEMGGFGASRASGGKKYFSVHPRRPMLVDLDYAKARDFIDGGLYMALAVTGWGIYFPPLFFKEVKDPVKFADMSRIPQDNIWVERRTFVSHLERRIVHQLLCSPYGGCDKKRCKAYITAEDKGWIEDLLDVWYDQIDAVLPVIEPLTRLIGAGGVIALVSQRCFSDERWEVSGAAVWCVGFAEG